MRSHFLLVFTITQWNVFGMPTHHEPHNQPATSARQQRGPYSLPITHQYLTNVHVIPLQNVYHNHQENRTVTQLVPVFSYIPLRHNYLVPVQDLQVIPLNRGNRESYQPQSKKIHYRMENRREDDVNIYRRLYGGYGGGLSYGGLGAGHGFQIFYG